MKLRNFFLQILAISLFSSQILANNNTNTTEQEQEVASMSAELTLAEDFNLLPACYLKPTFNNKCADLLAAVKQVSITTVRRLDVDEEADDNLNNYQSLFKSALCFDGYKEHIQKQEIRSFCGDLPKEELKQSETSNDRSNLVVASFGTGALASVVVGLTLTGPGIVTVLGLGALSGGIVGGVLGKYYYTDIGSKDGVIYGVSAGALGSVPGLVFIKINYFYKMSQAAAAIVRHGGGLYAIVGTGCTNGGVRAASRHLADRYGITSVDAQNLVVSTR